MAVLADIVETMTFRAGFNTNVVIAGTTLLGLATGVVGVLALLRKRSLLADALSHATLPGVAAAFIVAGVLGMEGRSVPILLLGAAASGVVAVLAVHGILRHPRIREDAAIGLVLSVSFGIGVIGLSYIQTNVPDGAGGINAFIFGQTATMQPGDVAMMATIAAVAIIAAVVFFKEFAVVGFNDAFARSVGWPVGGIDLLLMTLIVLVTVSGLQAVGLILVVSMLIVPAVAARFWTEHLRTLLVFGGLIGAASGYLGSVASAVFPRTPAGAVIVLAAGAIFTLSLLAAPSRGAVAAVVRRLALRLRIAGDHLLELAHDQSADEIEATELRRIARARGWSPPFRAAVLWTLRRNDMTASKPGTTTLAVTDRGRERGARVARNHALWEQYLIHYADIAPSHVDWSVDQVEHVLDEELVRRLEARLAIDSQAATR